MKSNFDFLNRYWPALAQIGATAETYVYSDPNACIYRGFPRTKRQGIERF